MFAQYQLPVSDSILLTFGGRYESVTYDYDNKLLDGRTKDDGTACGFGGCRFSRPSDREDTFRNFSPKISFSQFLNDTTQWYLQLSRGFRAPQATELYRLQNTQVVSDIDSEELDSLEITSPANLTGVTRFTNTPTTHLWQQHPLMVTTLIPRLETSGRQILCGNTAKADWSS